MRKHYYSCTYLQNKKIPEILFCNFSRQNTLVFLLSSKTLNPNTFSVLEKCLRKQQESFLHQSLNLCSLFLSPHSDLPHGLKQTLPTDRTHHFSFSLLVTLLLLIMSLRLPEMATSTMPLPPPSPFAQAAEFICRTRIPNIQVSSSDHHRSRNRATVRFFVTSYQSHKNPSSSIQSNTGLSLNQTVPTKMMKQVPT